MEALTNKQFKSYNYISRYSPFASYYHTLDNKYITATDNWIKDTSLYEVYSVQKGDTYDSLALRFYNNPTYYWLICAFNRILDPYEIPIPGSKLKIPSISNIEFIDRG